MTSNEVANLVRDFRVALTKGNYEVAETLLRRLKEVEPQRTRRVLQDALSMLDMDEEERLRAFPWLRFEDN